jgi:molybdate transport system permease protein
VSLPFGVGLAYLLARGRFWGRRLLELLVDLPLVLPPVVTGYLLLVALGPRGPIGALLERWFGARLVFNWEAAALASAVVSFPLLVRAARIAFEEIDPRLSAAARSLGAGRFDAFVSVSLPLAWRGIVAGMLLAFAPSLGEFGATIMVAGNIEGQTRTIPLALYSLVNRPGGVEQSWRLVVVSILLAAAALVVSALIERRHARREPA